MIGDVGNRRGDLSWVLQFGQTVKGKDHQTARAVRRIVGNGYPRALRQVAERLVLE
jgi:hypothetical protein